MNLVIIETDNSADIKIERLKKSNGMMKIRGEYIIERLIRIGRFNGIKKVYCIINQRETKIKHYLSANNFENSVKIIEQDKENTLHDLFTFLSVNEPFLVIKLNSVFNESEFSEFLTYSLLQEDADGILAVKKYGDDENPHCVAINNEDIILKFSDAKEGYSWAEGSIYYFSPRILNEMKYALHANIYRFDKFLQLLISKGYILKAFSFSKIINVESVLDITKAEDLIGENNYV